MRGMKNTFLFIYGLFYIIHIYIIYYYSSIWICMWHLLLSYYVIHCATFIPFYNYVIKYSVIFSLTVLLMYLSEWNNISNIANIHFPSKEEHMGFNESSVNISALL